MSIFVISIKMKLVFFQHCVKVSVYKIEKKIERGKDRFGIGSVSLETPFLYHHSAVNHASL